MKEHPILFSGPMVQAILEGRKTQTRRVVRERSFPPRFHVRCQHIGVRAALDEFGALPCPYGQPGDRLWVRETFSLPDDWDCTEDRSLLDYQADLKGTAAHRWRPSIHMPRWASRLLLEVTEVRVQRVQEISGEDAKAEGVNPIPYIMPGEEATLAGRLYQERFRVFWDSINADRGYGWGVNPWVWAISFRRIEP